MNANFNTVAFYIPEDLETYTFQSGKNTLVIREPIAADFLLIEGMKENPNIHERTFLLTQRLSVSWNGKPGVTTADIGSLNLKAYSKLMEKCTQFFLDVMGDIGSGLVQKYLSDQFPKLQQSGEVRADDDQKNIIPNPNTQ